jgi:hypothetical protein
MALYASLRSRQDHLMVLSQHCLDWLEILLVFLFGNRRPRYFDIPGVLN